VACPAAPRSVSERVLNSGGVPVDLTPVLGWLLSFDVVRPKAEFHIASCASGRGLTTSTHTTAQFTCPTAPWTHVLAKRRRHRGVTICLPGKISS